MQRDVPYPEAFNTDASGDAILTFAEVTHPALSEPLRVVTDVLEYTWNVVLWSPVMFTVEALTDSDRPTEARIVLPAIDQTITNALIDLPDRARISIWVLSSADFDLSVEPRAQIGTPVPAMELLNFDLVDINGTVMDASGRLMLRDYSQEPWPGVRATQSRCPGLFT